MANTNATPYQTIDALPQYISPDTVVENSNVAVTLDSTGPVGSTAGAPTGWLQFTLNGANHYTPFW
jgi:hypothetical protein